MLEYHIAKSNILRWGLHVLITELLLETIILKLLNVKVHINYLS